MLEVDELTVHHGTICALEDVTFTCQASRLIAVIGPNGAGKSSLLNAITGTLTPTRGSIRVDGREATAARDLLTFVPQGLQTDHDFPATVRDIVVQGRWSRLGLWRRLSASDHRAVDDALQKVGLGDLAYRPIHALSGGQRQRMFVARALARGGSVYLLDEPFAGVDATSEAAILDVLRGLRDDGALVLVVHHDLSTVSTFFDDAILLQRTLVAAGPAREVCRVETLRMAYGPRLSILAPTP